MWRRSSFAIAVNSYVKILHFTENVGKSGIRILRSPEFDIVHCLREMGINGELCFQLGNMGELLSKCLMAEKNGIFFAVNGRLL